MKFGQITSSFKTFSTKFAWQLLIMIKPFTICQEDHKEFTLNQKSRLIII